MPFKGIQCDNQVCDWKDLSITPAQMIDWVNAPCPKCGENVLTDEDYDDFLRMCAAFQKSGISPAEDINESTFSARMHNGTMYLYQSGEVVSKTHMRINEEALLEYGFMKTNLKPTRENDIFEHQQVCYTKAYPRPGEGEHPANNLVVIWSKLINEWMVASACEGIIDVVLTSIVTPQHLEDLWKALTRKELTKNETKGE